MSRNGTNKPSSRGFTLSHILGAYGMRKISGYGDNVWEFYNRNYDVIGLPFVFARKPSLTQLQSVAYEPSAASDSDVHFYIHPGFGTKEYWERIGKVMGWKLREGQLEVSVDDQIVPHTYGKHT